MKTILLLSCAFATCYGYAQQTPVGLAPYVAVGALNGSEHASVALQASLLYRFPSTSVGLGTGIDYYRLRSIPAYAVVHQWIGRTRKNVLIYGQAGYHFDWITHRNKAEMGFEFASVDFTGGMYYDAGVGYRVSLKEPIALVFSGGYSFKQVTMEDANFICLGNQCYPNTDRYDYKFRRLVLKVGVTF